ncbi:MAG: RagB/SusD family nutrient uptake outer membrane protein [Bacteroidota bacterium]
MKKLIYLTAILSIVLTTYSCDDFLDREPLDQIVADNFYENENEVNLALIGSYAPLLDIDWTGKGWMITEIPSDNSQPGGTDPDFSPIDNFTVTADNIIVGNYWAKHYQMVTYANTVIARVNNTTTIDEASKQPFLAEAKFLRAVAYFDLVRVFGGVPLITDPPIFEEDLLYPRSTVPQVYELIIEDFRFASEHLPVERGGGELGRATKGAAMTYLSKVFLSTRDFVQAKDFSKAVMELGVYELMSTYEAVFELATNDNNIESIFQAQYAGCGPFGTGNPMQAFFAPWGEGITKDRDGWGSHVPTGPSVSNPNTTMLDAYEVGDLRKKWTVMTPNEHYPNINAEDGGYTYPPGGASATNGNIKKYVVGSGSNICFMSTPQNAHLLRYADVLLTYAEAQMEIDGGITADPAALDAFNAVRQRAGLDPIAEINKEIMLAERRVEFGFEGHRWFDLIRSNRAVEILRLHGKNLDIHNLLFPIPSGELQVNPNLKQNPGY